MADVIWTNVYPAALNTIANQPALSPGDKIKIVHQTAIQQAVWALEAEVGTNPGESAGSLRGRVAALEGGSGGGLTTALDLDLTGEANQDFKVAGDGDHVLSTSGLTVYTVNHANAAKLAMTNGVGLEMDSTNVSTNLFDATRTAPIFGIKLTEILASLKYMDWSFIRVWCLVSENSDENFERFSLMFERKQPSFVGATYHNWQGFRGHPTTYAAIYTGNGSSNITPTTTDLTSDDVLMLKLYSAGNMEFYSGQSSGGNFPDVGAMRLRNNPDVPDDLAMRFDEASEMAIGLALVTVNVSANYLTTTTRLKVEYK